MLDLSARVFYKAHFEIEAKYNDVSTFDEIIYGLYNWLHYKYGHPIAAWNWQQFRRFGEFQIDDGRVEATSTSFWNYDLLNWACKIEEYQIQDSDNDEGQMAEAPRIWTTEVGFEQVSQEKAVLSYVLYYRDKAGFIGRIAPLPNPSVPGFVKSLLYNKKIRCLIGNDTLRVRSSILKCGSGKAFAERIANDERVVPYILVLPDVVDGEIEYKVEAESIAKNVMGNALVFSVESMGVVDEINYYLDRDLNCRQGQIMIYWSAGSLSRYRFISARQVENLGESEIIEVLRRVFSTDIKYYDTHEMFRMDDCNEMYRRKRISDMRAKMVATEQLSEENASTNTELREQLKNSEEFIDYADKELASKESQINALREQLSEQKNETRGLQCRIDSMISVYNEAQGQLTALQSARQISEMPTTALDVGTFFQKVFPEKIDFSERGFRSLKNCSTKIETLWECFYQIATHLTDMYRAGSSDIEEEYKTKTGWTLKRGEGKMTRKDRKLMAQRIDIYDGREISIEPHVANGNKESDADFIRVYFAYDGVSQKIIIGHVGKHLDNYTTKSL